jgi:F-type H+-transporting ATPase subunit a
MDILYKKKQMNENYVISPLDQIEIRDLLSIDISLLNNSHISITNIGLYLSIGIILIINYSLLSTNQNKLAPNN